MSSDIAWFSDALNKGEGAPVKRQYLKWHADASGNAVSYTEENPLFLTSAISANWTLSELLWRARLIAMDERTLWECIGPELVDGVLQAIVDKWNEQQAIKQVYYFLEHLAESCEAGAVECERLRRELDKYAMSSIKPRRADGSESSPSTSNVEAPPLQPLSSTTAVTLAVPAEWSSNVNIFPMVDGDDYSEGSLICVQPVASFSVLLTVPRQEMFFHATVVQYCTLGRVIASDSQFAHLLENEEALLVSCLVYEQFIVGPAASHWRQLLTHCPAHYPTVPSHWDIADLSELDGFDMLDDVLAKRTQLNEFHSQIVSFLPSLHSALIKHQDNTCEVPPLMALTAAFAVEHLLWAKTTFDSRAFNLNVDGATVLSLVPLADMINHNVDSDVLIRKVEANGGPFTMQIGAALSSEMRDIGRELWMSYGPLQNWELLQHYGFVLSPHNPHDKLPFPISLPSSGDAYADEGEDRSWHLRRTALMQRYHLIISDTFWIPYHGAPPSALLALLRIQLAQPDEFTTLETQPYGPFIPLSLDTEYAILDTVQQTVQCTMDLFPTTLEEDIEALKAESSDSDSSTSEHALHERHTLDNYRLCLRLRAGIKSIARRTCTWCEEKRKSITCTHSLPR